MEYVNCNLCGADEARFIFQARDRNSKGQRFFKIVKCRKCGLVYLNPRPDEKEIREYYSAWYHFHALAGTVALENTKVWGTPWREVMARKVKPILRHKSNGRILDVGCGDGSLLRYLKGLGWQTYGVEPNEIASRYGREILGLNIFSGRLEAANYPQDSFDIITLFHALEHVHHPVEILKSIAGLLKKDGLLIAELPNFASFESRVFRSRWVGVAAPLHLYNFTPRTLALTLKKSGFTPVRLEFVSPPYKYLSGYSGSLRYCLMDLGVYPPREKWAADMEDEKCAGSISLSWNNPLHFMEYIFFYPLARFMDKIGWGSGLRVTAGKENRINYFEVKK